MDYQQEVVKDFEPTSEQLSNTNSDEESNYETNSDLSYDDIEKEYEEKVKESLDQENFFKASAELTINAKEMLSNRNNEYNYEDDE